MVFEILGCNLLSIVRLYKSKGLPLALVKIITKQILIALDFLHTDCSIIHTDLKPENVLLRVNPTLGSESTAEGAEGPKASAVSQASVASSSGNSTPGSSSSAPAAMNESGERATSSENKRNLVPNGDMASGAEPDSAARGTRVAPLDVAGAQSEKSATGQDPEGMRREISELNFASRGAEILVSGPSVVPKGEHSVRTSFGSGSGAASARGEAGSDFSLRSSKSVDSLSVPSCSDSESVHSVTASATVSAGSSTTTTPRMAMLESLPTDKEGLLRVFGDGAFRVKIADLGNACWTYKHFEEDVQTRHYRAPRGDIGL